MTITPERAAGPTRPILIELVGPPGAGKSTLVETLRLRDSEIALVPWPRRTKASLVYRLINNAGQLVPLVMHGIRAGALCNRNDLREIALFLERRDAAQRHSRGRKKLFCTYGPLYRLGRLRVEGSSFFCTVTFKRWENRWWSICGSKFDMIVWLDAPDTILIRRIDTEDQLRRLKGRTSEAMVKAFDRHRAICREMLENSGVPMLRIDTSQQSVDEAAARVYDAIRKIQDRKLDHLARRDGVNGRE